MPMDLFRENAALARIFIPGWRANHCPWIFSVKMPHWRGFSSPGGGQTIAHGSFLWIDESIWNLRNRFISTVALFVGIFIAIPENIVHFISSPESVMVGNQL
ncbi:hypothetical protein ACPVTF_15000 [Geobacillus icigianus]|uniref:hypothetical protein n=1 Tax=Geobacillus icigianus TaxID=1430331 RepID=UPI003D01D05C